MKTQQYFANCTTLDTLTKERNRLAKLYHPDLGGDVRVMQEINAQFEAAKKLLSAPPAPRVYACPRDPWKDLYEQATRQAQQWAADVERQRKEQERQDRERHKRNEEVLRQKLNLKEELDWALEECRKAQRQGLLRDCQLFTDRMQTTLFVGGKTFPYRAWFRSHGFTWQENRRKWQFVKRPEVIEDYDNDDFEYTDIPF